MAPNSVGWRLFDPINAVKTTMDEPPSHPAAGPALATAETSLSLQSFRPVDAPLVASWVDSIETRRWVSPSAIDTITADRVCRWVKPGGEAFVLTNGSGCLPEAYGELNPMRLERDHYWLGHLIVCPARRGRGVGLRLVQALVQHAFRDRLAKRVSLIVFPDNRAAVRCYRRAGFRLSGEEFHRFPPAPRNVRLLRYQMEASQFVAAADRPEACVVGS